MRCPFASDTLLPNIAESVTLQQESDEKIKAFKLTLTPEQAQQFGEIDDMMIAITTYVQHNTVRELICPSCNKKKCP